jgi:hypothetical protein
MVEHGQISAVNLNVGERAMAPTLLGSNQLHALKNNDTGLVETNEMNKKQFRNPLPPGTQSNLFSNTDENIPRTSANGFFNAKTGEYKLPAGSIIDLKTVNIIPPPTNAVFDPNSKTYLIPENYGKINKTNGDYIPPEGLKLEANGKFVIIDAQALAKTQVVNKEDKKESDNKAPPAETQSTAPKTPDTVKVEVPKIYDARVEMTNFTAQFAPPPVQGNPTLLTDAQRELATNIQSTNSAAREKEINLGKTISSRNLKFVLNAQ